MALRVRIEHGQDAGKTIRLPGPGSYRFGRAMAVSFQVLDMKVSKEHFEIVIPNGTGGTPTIRDLGSTHGTLLNAQRVAADAVRPLNAGDEIRIGLTVMRVLSDGPCEVDLEATGPAPQSNGASTTTASAAGGSTPGGNGGARASAAKGGKTLPPDELVGKTLAGYKILEKVGAGGMGAVYRAEQLSLHREVALKVLNDRLVSDSAFVDQFVNEARAAGQLNHPNVVQVYDVGQTDGRHFFSMEFIEGGALEGKLPRTGGVPWQDVLPWFLDAANALIFAEKKGILHRDIKPDNFMLSQDGSVKLCDLGLAKKSESADLLSQGIIGTPHFISPEAIRRRADVDRRSDLYSLGCTFYRLLTGKNPYPAPNVKEILLAQLNAPVPRPSATGAEVPKELDDVVVKLMQKDPAARYQSAEELWKALDKIRLQFGMEAHGLHPGRAKKIAIVAGVLGLAAVGVAVYFVFIKPPEIQHTETIRDVGQDVARKAQEATRVANAARDLGDIRLRAATQIGVLEDGDKWSDPRWEDVITALRKLATDYPKTPSAQEATTEADSKEKYIREKKDADKKFRDAWGKAVGEANDYVKKALEKIATLRAEKKWFEAEQAAAGAITALNDDFAKRKVGDRVLLDDAAVKMLKGQIDAEKNTLVAGLEADAQEADGRAAVAGKPDTAAALEEAAGILQTWLKDNPDRSDRTTALGLKLADLRLRIQKAADDLAGRATDKVWVDKRADRALYFGLLKRLYTPRSDESEGGLYARFQFSEAVSAATKEAAKAKTPDYQRLFDARIREATLLRDLFGGFSEAFKAAPVKDSVAGTGWKGIPKDVGVESLTTADNKAHRYADEGIGWFLDFLYDKAGKERIPLSADAHEALGDLALAGVALASKEEDAALADKALAEWAKAGEMDPARKAALDGRKPAVEAERQALQKWVAMRDQLLSIRVRIDEWEGKLDDANKNREQFKTTEAAALRKELDDVRAKRKDLETTLGSTLVWNARVETQGQSASYYPGEKVPPPLPPAPQKPPHAPGGTPGGGMGGAPPAPSGMSGEPPVPPEPTPGNGGAMDGK